MKPTLSVVLATFNEAENITLCLKSIKGLADEVIVVDGSSEDDTRKLAKKFGAKVFKVKNHPMFHTNKQKAVELVSGRWVLQLDADEQVSPQLAAEIKKIVTQKKTPFAGYNVARKNFFLSRFLTKGGQYPDYVIRLFLNGRGHFPQKSVHEQIVIKGKVGFLKNDLTHYADPNFARYLTRFNRYTDLDAAELARLKEKPGFSLGLSYFIFKPTVWFVKAYFRHKGFVDGLPGFIFALMSSLRFPVIFIKLWERYARRP
ncbi:MAG: Glycosyltransferase involved in cell wall biogenesis [Candidatus Beckwithbacteria bacterium GW2011_GWB1_47_15]|uniref:Glycosyltransferase involved in cell wall biogenesis n=1 Tax=Candidatus Beckwithbacteria bacterium GW2011_GWB1_47_15 TaxID=1618371 RepID=A0A0G1RUZ4_9BACT|nr:MAG: cell wall biosynthesis glycosyltransferase [Candidatus Beckwithbacteria bacterium GW2011_GWC1_49_16]KKU35723.1 MAG: Glycosyltransferase involved in cell wall biogenesis [Candidatus Beckwithbacteria bacterium GW2011_GWA1_46_30]KKU60977.1 MAG: Glycosyltransferase involved in cell wall biogenesis [Candidatus Beckwithbacteria bacterium GW2011_GWB1_47_15]KKU72282.1 MAG: Glycosyltransferase involved in cell wall biogenesis [Candidatus Beckwithbacteria bacterium GW2011_GWA2_47_25]KKW04958.1 MA